MCFEFEFKELNKSFVSLYKNSKKWKINKAVYFLVGKTVVYGKTEPLTYIM